MDKLSITQKVKQILENGNEDVILEKQTIVPLNVITTKQLTVSAIKVNLDESVFRNAFNNDLTVNSGYIYFEYVNNNWRASHHHDDAVVNLQDYGISLELNGNSVKAEDTILVYCQNNKIEKVYYESDILVYEGAGNDKFNYIKVECNDPNVDIEAFGYLSTQYGITKNIFAFSRYRAESFISTGQPQVNTILLKPTVKIGYKEYFENAKVDIVVARVDI